MGTSTDRDLDLEAFLLYLKRSRGFDFTGYKRASLARRIDKRMQTVRADGYAEYRTHLETHPEEFEQLFDTILINVTSFFRDEDAWDFLRAEIVPRIVAAKGPGEPIRVWSAACATGEEAYSLAMLFADALGPEEFRGRVKIYATDVDEAALTTARHAAYAPRAAENLPAELVERYFEPVEGQLVFRKDIRRSVVFGRNDLIQDAPISRIDLLVCRNALMYFDSATQARILGRFYFALNDGGILFLGRAETLLTHGTMFTPVDLKRRLFQKASRPDGRRIPAMGARVALDTADVRPASPELCEAVLRGGSVAQLVVDRSGSLVLANDRANVLFRLGAADLGRQLSDLDVSYRPVDLRSLIDQAYAERRVVVRTGIEWRPGGSGELRWFDLHVTPLHATDASFLGTTLSFMDVTPQRQLQLELEQSEHELQAAYEELQSTNEELETTNEELQSTVEELETTNEELQSTNEELETMNEELQSTNEELQAMNDEFRVRGDQADGANELVNQILTSLDEGVAVLDPELRVLVWNRKAEDLWGVRASEVQGSHFLELDIGLPVGELRRPIRDALAGGETQNEIVLAATNRRGKPIHCRVTCSPLASGGTETPGGVVVVMAEIAAGAAAN